MRRRDATLIQDFGSDAPREVGGPAAIARDAADSAARGNRHGAIRLWETRAARYLASAGAQGAVR